MMNKKIVSLFALFGLFGFVYFAFAAPVIIPNPLNVDNFGALLLKIAGGIGVLIGSLGTIMIIVAGILYLTSAGSPERMGSAKKALFYAIAGIAIGISATAIVATIQWVLK
ncbi:MAG: hypothetical protein A2998_01470 [Candidatus Staskawiczbacteria bacterium RIFCSPLOWO2_01_FULL_37_25b]|uniref:TrbC/VIRB2 family protein n=2 Tax=Candidatus Staskawicziibacteriota TaxID=1817916 RepID=A0A1G2ICZ8_9BACT|nr:MAG: hypothetical protein A2998_01470 [Candidatus Staskawiczbacteria bacterium RIFCSPLOWO2_01_FULL_37_25b]